MEKNENIHTPACFVEAYGSRDWRWYQNLLATVIREGKPGVILDIGAGLGLFTECAYRWGIKCVALEGSEYAVSEAKMRVPELDIRLHYLDDPFPLEEQSVDTVLCYQTIEHLYPATARKVLLESYRVLRKGGVLLVYSPSIYNKKEQAEESHVNLYSPRRLRSELGKAGFHNVGSIDSPLTIFGQSKMATTLANIIFKATSIERLSATANCIAQKN